jgi:hypothetical protein
MTTRSCFSSSLPCTKRPFSLFHAGLWLKSPHRSLDYTRLETLIKPTDHCFPLLSLVPKKHIQEACPMLLWFESRLLPCSRYASTFVSKIGNSRFLPSLHICRFTFFYINKSAALLSTFLMVQKLSP